MTDWRHAAAALTRHRMRAMAALAPRFDVPLKEGPRQGSGLRFLGEVYFTFPHPLYPPDPAAVRAMKEFLPDYVPLWGRWFFLGPADDAGHCQELQFDRHVIARRVRSPRLLHRFGETQIGERLYRSQIVGPEPAEGWPNYLEGPWHYTRERGDPKATSVGDFAPHGMEMVRFLREVRVRPKPGETMEHAWKERILHAPRRRARLLADQRRAQQLLLERERQRYEQKQIERAGETDFNRQIVQRLVEKREVRYNVPGGSVVVKMPLPRIPGVTA